MQKGFAHLVILISIVVIVFIVVGASYLGTRKDQPVQDSVKQAFPSVSPISDPIVNWKTYTNNSFVFKYPSDWVISGNEIKSSSPKIRIYMTEDASLMNECMEEISVNKQNSFFIKKFQRVVTGTMCNGGDSTARELWVIPKEGAYGPGIIIYYSSKDEAVIESIFNQIFSSFKFTDVSDETTNWKMFTNKNYGYSLEYPSDWSLLGTVPGQTLDELEKFWYIVLTGPEDCQKITDSCGHITITVEVVNNTDSLLSAKEIWLRDLSKNMRPVVGKEENIEINGIKATKISYVNNFLNGQTSVSTAPIPMKTFVLIHNNKIYKIDIRELLYLSNTVGDYKNAAFSEWVYDSLYNQIFAGFKFTD